MMGVVVVGFNGSASSCAAVERAVAVSSQLDAQLHVVAVVTDSVEEFDSADESMLSFDVAETMLDQLASAYAERGISILTVALPGVKAARVLSEYAHRSEAELLVIGNKHMQGLRRMLGSVANDVSHHARCDVLIVKTT